MDVIGIFEAKTNLSRIIERVMKGEEFIVTKHDRAVARIIPEETKSRELLVKEYERFRREKIKLKQRRSGLGSLKELAREGLK